MSPATKALWAKYYPNFRDTFFEEILLRKVGNGSSVLELGAGSGAGMQNFFCLKGKVARYAGVDRDPRVLGNRHLDEAYVADVTRLPFDDESMDLIFSQYLVEHVEKPESMLRESLRVLRRDGEAVFLTPSLGYYAMLIAAITPESFHRFYVDRFGSGRSEEEVFPTFYKMNTQRQIRNLARGVGFEYEISFVSTPPGYLRFNPVVFVLGILYQRTLERLFPPLRSSIIVTVRKPRC